MNDNFLYELRTPPSPEFASRLKARLDVRASEMRQQRRAFKWFAFGAILMGGTALAFVSPSMRQTAWTTIMQFRGTPAQEDAVESPARVAAVSARRSEPSENELEDAAANGAQQDASETTQVSAPANEARSATADVVPLAPRDTETGFIGGAATRPTVRIAHTESLTTLAENLAVDLGERLKSTEIDTVEGSTLSSLCKRNFQSVNADLVLSDRRLTDDERKRCSLRDRIVEIRIAYDPLVMIIHRENTWARSLALPDLKKLRELSYPIPVTTWSQVRPEWPTLPINLVGTSLRQSRIGQRFARTVGIDSTGFVFRDSTVIEEAKDDRATMRAVDNTLGAIGYIEWRSLTEVLRERSGSPTVAAIVDANGEAVDLTQEAIAEGRYPLAEPIWMYVDATRLGRFEVWGVVEQVLTFGPSKAIERSGFVNVGSNERQAAMRSLQKARTDTTRH